MLAEIAKRLNDEVFRQVFNQKTTIFLCGKSLEEESSLKRRIATQFQSSRPFAHRYAFVYPEELFEEVLSGPFHQDLLTLENELADSVDAVVLIPESYGAVAELGAFANHEKLREKLICVQETKYRKTKSFINYGPIRLLKDAKAGRVVYIDTSELAKAVESIKTAIAAIRKKSKAPEKSVNAINADRFLLPSIYVFEEPDYWTLCDLVKHAAGIVENEGKRARIIVEAGLSLLRKKGYVTRAAGGFCFGAPDFKRASECYKLTGSGIAAINHMNERGNWGHYFSPQVLDEIRVQILKRLCRGRQALLAS